MVIRVLARMRHGAVAIAGFAISLALVDVVFAQPVTQHGGERRSYVDAPFGQIHVRTAGSGPPMLLLHQTPMYAIQYDSVRPMLNRAGLRTVAPDTPGFGFSPAPAGAPEFQEYADQYVAVLDALGIGKAIIAGHHTGAALAVVFASRHPERVRCLILTGLPFYPEAVRKEKLAAVKPVADPDSEGKAIADEVQWQRQSQPPGHDSPATIQQSVVAHFLAEDRPRNMYRALFAYPGMASALKSIKVPTLLVTDPQDSLRDWTIAAHELRPDFPLRQLTFGGSPVLQLNPEEWSRVALQFVKGSCGGDTRGVSR